MTEPGQSQQIRLREIALSLGSQISISHRLSVSSMTEASYVICPYLSGKPLKDRGKTPDQCDVRWLPGTDEVCLRD